MEELSYLEKSKLPYSLLLDPQTGRAAAYTSNHRLVSELASKRLVEFALANTANTAAFDQKLHADGAPQWRPLPDWAGPDVQERLMLVWIRRPDGDAPDAEWLAIPKK